MEIKATDTRIQSIDPITNEALVRIGGELLIAYGERNLAGGITYRII